MSTFSFIDTEKLEIVPQESSISIKDIIFKQNAYKVMIRKNLDYALSTDRIKQLQNQLALNEYKFLMAKPEHLDQIITLLSNQYTLYNPISKLLNISKQQVYHIMKPVVSKKINLGKCLIGMYNDRIIACICCEDFYDNVEVIDALSDKFETNKLTQNEQHLMEILSLTEKDIFVQKKLKSLANNEYGSLFVNSFLCTDYEYKFSKFLFKFLYLLCVIITHFNDNTYSFGNATSSTLIKTMQNTFNAKILKSFDCVNCVFNDGIDLNYYFDKLPNEKSKKYLKRKCKNAAIIIQSKDINLMIQNLSNDAYVLSMKCKL